MQGLGGTGGKTAAAGVNCNRLVREGKLIPDSGSTPAFAEYVQGWRGWETCAYLKAAQSAPFKAEPFQPIMEGLRG
jgi:hypothetical protein